MIKSLLTAGFNAKIKDKTGKTACDYLQCEENDSVIETELKCRELRKIIC